MTKQPSSAQLARSERMRLAAIEGAKARADYEADGIAVRKNMARLRALRLAREAEAREAEEAARAAPATAGPKKKKAAKASSGSLSDWMQEQKSSGRAT